jgi:hypothetical protein
MVRARDVASTLLSLVWRATVPVVGVGLLVGTFSKGDADPEGVEPPGKGRVVVSDQGAHVLVTMGDAGTENFSTCIVQDESRKELARINLYKDGAVNFAFVGSSALRGSGALSRSGGVDLGVGTEVGRQYLVSVHPDGSSVVDVVARAGDRHRILRLSPRGDVLRD